MARPGSYETPMTAAVMMAPMGPERPRKTVAADLAIDRHVLRHAAQRMQRGDWRLARLAAAWCGRCRAAPRRLVGAVDFAGAAGSAQERGVDRERLPGAMRARSFRNTARSCARGITFSCPRWRCEFLGAVVVRRALPSFSTRTTAPESATRKLAPVMPMPASRNFWRSTRARLG